MEKVSIIIPAYNEGNRIKKTLECYGKFFRKLKKEKRLDFEIINVLNACTDNTPEIAKKTKRKFSEIKVIEIKEKGKGLAIVRGFREALKGKSKLIGFSDADMATSPEEFYKLIKEIDGYGGVIASRWKEGSVVKVKQTLLRRFLSRGFNFIVRGILLLNYQDTQCGAKLFKREAIKKVIDKLGATQWAFDVDILYKLKKEGIKVKEVPTVWEDRKGSKINLINAPLQMFLAVIRLRLIDSPFRFIVKLYDKL